MEIEPIELHLHTVESLLKELISGRNVLVNKTEKFKITSNQSRAILNWYKQNQDKWSKQNREEDVKLMATLDFKNPPIFPPIQFSQSQKQSLNYHIKEIEINQFGGINKFSDTLNQGNILKFDLQKSISLFQGHNGAGKTSLLSAICWCLSGFVYRSQNPPQKIGEAVDLSIEHNGTNILKKASIITPVPPSNYIKTLLEDKIPLNTWVKISFTDDAGTEIGFIKRSLNWSKRGSNIVELTEGFDVLGLDPISFEIGTKIPSLIPYIQLDSASDLGKAIAELTGLRAILDLVKHATKSKDKLTGALTSKKIEEINELNRDFDQKREELLGHFKSYPDITPQNDIPLSNDNNILTKLDKHIIEFEKLLSDSLTKVKEILGENFKPDDPIQRDELARNISIAIDSLGNHNIKELESAKKLGTIKNLFSDISNIERKIKTITTEAEEIEKLASTPNIKSREQLYARISNWILQNNHDKTICPVCSESLNGKIDRVTNEHISKHIQDHLDNPKEFLSYSINQWGTGHIKAIESEYKTISSLMELPATPQDLIKKIFVDELFEKPCFKLSLAPIKDKVKLLTDKAIEILPQYIVPKTYTLPKSIIQNCDILNTFLNHLQKIIAFAKWRSSIDEECKRVFEMILAKRDKLPDQVIEYTLTECLNALQAIINNSSPIKIALDKIKELSNKIKIDRKKLSDQLSEYKDASDALDDIIKLGDHVNNQIKSLMQQLSDDAKQWKKKLYNPAYKGHPEFAGSDIDANGALQIQAEIQGTRTAAQHVSNSSDLRSTLLAVFFALWEYLFKKRGGISLIILDDLHELFDERNYHNYIDTLPDLSANGAKILIATNSDGFSRLVKIIPDPNQINHICIHPINENTEHISLGSFIEKIEQLRDCFEKNVNDHLAAQEYMKEFRIYLEQQIGDLLADICIKKPLPTLADYIGELRSLYNGKIIPFHCDIVEKIINHSALKSDSDFLRLTNKCHHRTVTEIAYNDVNANIQKQCKELLSLTYYASKYYYLWLQRRKVIRTQKPEKPESLNIIQKDIPLYENIAAACSNVGGESDSTYTKFEHELLNDCAVYYLKTNNFGFAANIGYKAIVKLNDPAKPHSLVIALHKDRVFARRYSESIEGGKIVLTSEMLQFDRRPPAQIFPAEEVELLEVIGFLFDEQIYSKNKNNNEAVLIEDYKFPNQITMAFKINGDSAMPLALKGQTILGGSQILPENFDKNIGKMIALVTNENEQVFKKIGRSIRLNSHRHLRMFDAIGGLGESRIYRTEDLENDSCEKVPFVIPNSIREIVGVIYTT
ncbi:MAG: AAA family ATPase [Phycisphaerales bacterium]